MKIWAGWSFDEVGSRKIDTKHAIAEDWQSLI